AHAVDRAGERLDSLAPGAAVLAVDHLREVDGRRPDHVSGVLAHEPDRVATEQVRRLAHRPAGRGAEVAHRVCAGNVHGLSGCRSGGKTEPDERSKKKSSETGPHLSSLFSFG